MSGFCFLYATFNALVFAYRNCFSFWLCGYDKCDALF